MKNIILVTTLALVCCSFTSSAAQDNDVDNVYKAMITSFTERDLHERWVPHTDLVLNRAKRLLEVVEADSRTALIGAILHDIGKGNEDHEKDGAKIAEKLLVQTGFDKEFTRTIYRIVENHHKAQCDHTNEFIVVWLADRLRVPLPEDDKELLKLFDETRERLKDIGKQ
ncbi:MAG: HD domain-containing protein [bacterium]|nr:HD domain-containing protein [bacterium]